MRRGVKGCVMALGIVALVIGLNLSWAHAAVAYAISGDEAECPHALTEAARVRVSDIYWDVQAVPLMLCLDGPVIGLDVAYGSTRFAPLLPAIVVLGPKGQNIDVAAHEIAHAEFSHRTGVLMRTFKVPTWFDEGLAMQLDRRLDYGEKPLRQLLMSGEFELPYLESIATPSEFYVADTAGQLSYAFAKCVVGAWIADEGRSAPLLMLEHLSWAAPFPTGAFFEMERACQSIQ